MSSSERRRQANLQNAQRSTGPRTSQGRAASSQNARRHGLSRPEPLSAAEHAMLEEIASAFPNTERRVALQFAMVELQLRRVRRAREELLQDHLRMAGAVDDHAFDQTEAIAYGAACAKMTTLWGYERKLLPRWRKLLKAAG